MSASTPVIVRQAPFALNNRPERQIFAAYTPLSVHIDDASPPFLAKVNLTIGDPALKLDGTPQFNSLNEFFKDVNAVCEQMRAAFNFKRLLIFKETQNTIQQGHVSDTVAKPDLVAGFEDHWYDGRAPATQKKSEAGKGGSADPHKEDLKSHMLWPLIRLAGEIALSSETQGEQIQHAGTYLDLLLEARPDFKAAFGLLLSENSVFVLVGETGAGIRLFSFSWGSRDLRTAMRAMVYRLYNPGEWANTSIEACFRTASTKDKPPSCVYNLTFPCSDSQKAPVYKNYFCRYGKSSFGTRTHVFVHGGPQPQTINGFPLRAIKIQLCRDSGRFNEIMVLNHIHKNAVLPGVIRLLCSHSSSHLFGHRKEIWLGLDKEGEPFMAIKTVREMLMVAYDVLEITRMLFARRRVLHRDISKGNVMYISRRTMTQIIKTIKAPDATAVGKNQGDGSCYCFVRYLLGESIDSMETSALLIDFNYSEIVPEDESTGGHAGTPMFMARAVQNGEPIKLEPYHTVTLVPIPSSAHLGTYEKNFPDRISRFRELDRKENIEANEVGEPTHEILLPWRQRLYHDAESVYWLMYYWGLLAKPSTSIKEKGAEDFDPGIPANIWTELHAGRKTLSAHANDTFHPSYSPLLDLFVQMRAYLLTDPHWFPHDSPRAEPDYIHECFQRLILRFLKDNVDKPFMELKKSDHERLPFAVPGIPARSSSTTDTYLSDQRAQRPETPPIPREPFAVNYVAPPVVAGFQSTDNTPIQRTMSLPGKEGDEDSVIEQLVFPQGSSRQGPGRSQESNNDDVFT
ncbi:other/FunK1 protein kinase [Coprinopsis cinerea okayama7|uniref:Other/FunK1 protein kinase n=1 Tax=Coprinopsis cinerea (strain Okayama-7 / 130 / ATCC MYA-4618 / FGSC 9003) TaxID=240176 RepID=A8NSP1_COPC7|nr:other/FunK1 protein kinase [Coprinopsis cinerea okayama7\|eukprot:XP_001836056.2 other/FunK1 protein kinase [Coprinopsis cinerea okayama7\